MPPKPRSIPGRLSAIPNFQNWMLVLRIAIDLAASTLGQFLGLVVWMIPDDPGSSWELPADALEVYLAGEVICFLSLALFGLYTPQRSLLDLRENRQLLRAWLAALAGTRLLLFLMRIPVSSSVLLCTWGAILPSLYFGRHFFHWVGERLHRAGYGERAALVYGAGETGTRLVRELRRTPELGIHVVGFLDDDLIRQASPVEELPVLGDFFQLEPLLAQGQIRQLFIALPNVPRRTILDILSVCRKHGVGFQIVPSVSDQILSLVELQDLDGVPLLGRQSMVLSSGPRLRKRILDLALAIPLLVLAGPFLLVLAWLLRRSTGGSAFTGITVAGVGDRPFRLYRLRTLPLEFKVELHRQPRDARLTWAGKLARRTLLEIAPELWNVVRGELSMVGPRPLTLRESASLEPEHRFRKELPPGLTGLWKIDPRPHLGALDELELDLLYLRLRSFLFDITVLLRSLDGILRRPPQV